MKTKQERPSVRFAKVLENTKRASMMIGINVMRDKFHCYPLTVVTIVMFVLYSCSTAYTVGMEMLTSADWKTGLKYSVVVSSGLQSLTRLTSGIRKVKEMGGALKFLHKLYCQYEERSEEYAQELGKCVDTLDWVNKIIRRGYIVIVGTIGAMPFLMWLIDGPRFLLLQYHIPGLNADTDTGYYLTNLIQVITVFIAGFGLYVGDLYMIIFLIHTQLFGIVLRLRVKDLNLMLNDIANGKSEVTEETITKELGEIANWHQLSKCYSEEINDVCHDIIATQVLTSGFSVVVSIFVLQTSNWPMGYLYLPLSYYCMIIFCVLGTYVEYANDGIEYDMNNIQWYHLKPRQRKMLVLMILATQRPITFSVLNVIPLTVSTGLKMTRLIYTMTMMISTTSEQK